MNFKKKKAMIVMIQLPQIHRTVASKKEAFGKGLLIHKVIPKIVI